MIDRIEEALNGLLSDPAQGVREAASGAMDRTRAKRSLDSFRGRFRSGGLEEKIRVIFAAAEMGGAEGVALLLDALSDGTLEVRGAAVRALSAFPTPVVLKALWEMLSKEKGIVLANIVEALGASGRKDLGPHVEKYLAHPDAQVRAKAVIATSRLTDGAGWERILKLRGDPEDQVRAAVAEALGNWTSSRP